MTKRFLIAGICILMLPLWLSPSPGDSSKGGAGAVVIALAGRTIGGDYCQCGVPGCICDPGEEPCGSPNNPCGGNMADPSDVPLPDPGGDSSDTDSSSDLDLGSGALLLLLAFFVWSRLRI